MEAYTSFAKVYDEFMDNIPYEEWADYIVELLKEYEIKNGLLLDLGCGTGSLTEILANRGYDMIGIDYSAEMLEIATAKREKSGSDILYLNQDMREFELYGTVKAVISICDSLNYLLEEEDLITTFGLVNNYLDPEGIFLFDLNTVYKYQELLGDTVIAENREEASFIWENYYDEEEQINEYDLTIFLQEKEDCYRKFEEVHVQRAYTLEKIKELLSKAGMQFIAAYDAFTKCPPKPDSERIYIVAREHGKKRKV